MSPRMARVVRWLLGDLVVAVVLIGFVCVMWGGVR